MKMISVGLIGVGKIAKTFHLPAWEQVDGARVLALVDPRLDEARRVGREFGITNVFRTIEDMLDGSNSMLSTYVRLIFFMLSKLVRP